MPLVPKEKAWAGADAPNKAVAAAVAVKAEMILVFITFASCSDDVGNNLIMEYFLDFVATCDRF